MKVTNKMQLLLLLLLLLLALALQPAVGFGLSNNTLLAFRNNKFFYCVRLLAPRQTPNLEDQDIPFCMGHHP
jgi:hypothetical protein